eukprot:TRINITY_DN433_c0_g2_i5.p1 TRINITY_DN433_c0_g2~~TRINITY_DN433_c0_g2_i5.p1  ORF type:complete len:194 (-),score=38.54 TRINITY_DN433_c0_g2_i5:84-665(-)
MHGTLECIRAECHTSITQACSISWLTDSTQRVRMPTFRATMVAAPVVRHILQSFGRAQPQQQCMLCPCRAQDHYAMALTTVSWALVEVPRYLFYVFNIMGNVPYPLFWLRYSLFAVLYPSGITGEIMTIVNGFDCLKALKPVPLAGGISISMYHMALLVLATYVPGAPFMYSHMVTTRRKQFKRRKAASKKAE